MNAQSVQPALRNFIETFYKNCRFIFTCNYKNKILDALHSRCTVIDFKITNGQVKKTAMAFLKRVIEILKTEKIKYEEPVVVQLIEKYYPDFRRTLNELQRYSVGGVIDSGVLYSITEIDTKKLMDVLKQKQFKDMRKWVVQNLDKEPVSLFRSLYENLKDYLVPQSYPHAVLIISKYQYQAAFVADQEINMVACLTEVMANCNFK